PAPPPAPTRRPSDLTRSTTRASRGSAPDRAAGTRPTTTATPATRTARPATPSSAAATSEAADEPRLVAAVAHPRRVVRADAADGDRKSTRLNSSHVK